MTVVYGLSLVDRNLIILLLQPIKSDLRLSDTQLGLLTGISFGVFYATAGLVIARWADQKDRSALTAVAIALWGLTMTAYLFVARFGQLITGRIAAAVGEAGCMPPGYSLIGDYFPGPGERAWALAIYWLASPLSSVVAFVAGGALNEHFGWRATFAIMGFPALFVAVLVKVTIADERSAGNTRPADSATIEVLRVLWQRQSLRHLCIAIVLLYLLSLGLAPWYAAFLIRNHAMSVTEVGRWLAGIFGTGGTLGVLLGGYVARRWLAHDERSQMRLSAGALLLSLPLLWLFLLLHNKYEALLSLLPFVAGIAFFLGPTFALMQRLVLDDMRARALAFVLLFANLVGMGMGPFIVGALSDSLRPALGSDSLRYAMLIASATALWASYHMWRVGRSVLDDLRSVDPPPHGQQAALV